MTRTILESWAGLRDWATSHGASAQLTPAPAEMLDELSARGAPDVWLRSLAVHDGDLLGVCPPFELLDAGDGWNVLAQGVPDGFGWPPGLAEEGPDLVVLGSGEVAEVRTREALVVAPSLTAWLSARVDYVEAGRVTWHALRGHAVTAERAPDTMSIPAALPDVHAANAALLAALRASDRSEIPKSARSRSAATPPARSATRARAGSCA